jgi:hypothetical protein
MNRVMASLALSAAIAAFLPATVVEATAQSGRSAGPGWAEEKQALIELGRGFATAADLYRALRERAADPQAPPGVSCRPRSSKAATPR